MNRTTATCIAGMRSKTTTGIKTHFQRPKKPRGRSLLRGFGVGIVRQESAVAARAQPIVMTRCRRSLTWRPREAEAFYAVRGFELCECSESVIIVRLTTDPH